MNPNELIEWLKEERLWALMHGMNYEIFNVTETKNDYKSRYEIRYDLKVPLCQVGVETILISLLKDYDVRIYELEIKRGDCLIAKNIHIIRYFDESTQDVLASQRESDFINRQGE